VDLEALMRCLGTGSCVVTQLTSGMIIGMLLFLIASGVTLIFGVLNVTNFAHGSLYMAGAYIALTLYQASGNYFIAAVGAAVAVGLLGVAFERLLMSKVYGSNVLMQLLVCYAVILMFGVALASFVPWIISVAIAAREGPGLSQNIGWMTRPGVAARHA